MGAFLLFMCKFKNGFYPLLVKGYQEIPSFSCKRSLTSADIRPKVVAEGAFVREVFE